MENLYFCAVFYAIVMKHILFAMMLGIVCMLSSCSNDDDPDYDYYVRYSVTAEANKAVDIWYTDADGHDHVVQTQAADGKYQFTVGPVKRGFKANLTVSYQEGGAVDYLMIEVSKENYPFVVKAQGHNYVGLDYTVE